jgi:hypothetical protein
MMPQTPAADRATPPTLSIRPALAAKVRQLRRAQLPDGARNSLNMS